MPTQSHDASGNVLISPAWHFVGSLVDRKPYRRTIAVPTAKTPRTVREIDAEFLTLEPRFINDMFDGESWRLDKGKPKGPFGITGEFGRNHCSRPSARGLHGHAVAKKNYLKPCPDSAIKSKTVKS